MHMVSKLFSQVIFAGENFETIVVVLEQVYII